MVETVLTCAIQRSVTLMSSPHLRHTGLYGWLMLEPYVQWA